VVRISIYYNTGQRYNLHDLKRQVVELKGRKKILGLIKKNKWRIAAELVRDDEHKIFIYTSLKEDGKFEEARTVYEYLKLNTLNVPPVLDSEIDFQSRNDLHAYLALPIDIESKTSVNLVLITYIQVYIITYISSYVAVVVVDSLYTIEKAMSLLEASLFSSEDQLKFVGVDSEWKASILGSRRCYSGKFSQTAESASIMQLATRDHVLIFDFLSLSKHKGSSEVLDRCGNLLERIFCDASVVKVGWGLQGDISMLSSVCRGRYGDIFANAKSILNLEKAFTKYKHLHILSLTKACEFYLRKPLNKKEQISDWDQRPLSMTQISYASLDAHSLLGILSVLCSDPTPDLLAVREMYPRQLVIDDVQEKAVDRGVVAESVEEAPLPVMTLKSLMSYVHQARGDTSNAR